MFRLVVLPCFDLCRSTSFHRQWIIFMVGYFLRHVQLFIIHKNMQCMVVFPLCVLGGGGDVQVLRML